MNDLDTWQVASISHYAGADLHHTLGHCSPVGIAHGLKVGAGSSANVVGNAARVPQLGVCSIDNGATSMLGDIPLERLQRASQRSSSAHLLNQSSDLPEPDADPS